MSKELMDLMDDLQQMQILFDIMIKGLTALSTESTDNSLRLTEHQAQQVAEYVRDMLDNMIKRVEEAIKEQFCEPAD